MRSKQKLPQRKELFDHCRRSVHFDLNKLLYLYASHDHNKEQTLDKIVELMVKYIIVDSRLKGGWLQ